MGQEWSWPCTVRKEQKKRLFESKYNFDDILQTSPNLEDAEDEGRNSTKLLKLKKIEDIIRKHEGLTPPTLRKKSASMAVSDNQSAFTFTDDSIADKDLSVVVIVEEIIDFYAFLVKYLKQYGQDMIPSFILPHPSSKKAIVVFQPASTVKNYTPGNDHQFIEFEKDFRNIDNKTSYQILMQFLRQCAEKDLEYVGYYLDDEMKYHFVFYQREGGRGLTMTPNFQTLEDLTQEDIEQVLGEATDMSYRIRGMITLVPTRMSPKSLTFVVIEKAKLDFEQYLAVSSPEGASHRDGVDIELSKKIDILYQSDNLDLAGVFRNPAGRGLYLIFSR